MIRKDSLIILNMLLEMLVQCYGFNVDELLSNEQIENINKAIKKRIGEETTKEDEKKIFKNLFDKYVKKLK